MAAYHLIAGHPAVLRISDGAVIPFAAGNTDYSVYVDWLALGNTPDPAPPPPPGPVIEQSATSLLIAQAKTHVQQGNHAEALDAILQLLERTAV
jgi:hypothetical protein